MSNAEHAKQLRVFAEDLTGIDPEAHGPAIELCREAADALEAADKRIADLADQLAHCQTSRQKAREEVLRVLDKRLAGKDQGK